ncbi:MAG: hypothetical protein MUC62_09410 [Candidatus Thermoplasmatota archaeon]|jgi:hypothetical protein|nr:hypothetical protein [Candidatus Thermoplasmatota archaeon]
MMTTTIALRESTRNDLMLLKMERGYDSVDALLEDMIVQYRKERFLERAREFKARMDARGLGPRDLH